MKTPKPKRLSRISSKLPRLRGKKEQIITEKIPLITNESIAEHREKILGSGRKYIYPLRHSKHRVVKISILLFVFALIAFFVWCMLALYRFQSTSSFTYGVVRVIPFPVARAADRWVSYESYLFELRHYMHYYDTQQGVDFSSESGKRQLVEYKKQALDEVVRAAYVKELAKKHDLTVTNGEVNDQVALVRQQNRLGASDEVFRNVLNEYWGWSVGDFRRELRNELLEQKVAGTLDTATHKRAKDALNQLQAGADFATLATQVSDDVATKANGGDYGVDISRASREVSPKAVEALYTLQVGQITDIINSGSHLEINKLLAINGDKLRAAHITFNFADITTYTDPVQKADPPRRFIKVGE